MKTIINDFNNTINESHKFRKEDLSDGSILISNKEESIFNRITPPHGFFTHRPAYFFDVNIGDTIYVDSNISIRSYIKAAYLDYIAKRYNGIIRESDTLIDNKYKDVIEDDIIQMGIIYADGHCINDTYITLKSEVKVEKIIKTTIKEANRYLGFKIKYINLDNFIQGINDNYSNALDLLRSELYSEENISTYINGSIETSFIGNGIAFDSMKYNTLNICSMDISNLDGELSDSIIHELSNNILKDINNKLPREFYLNLIVNYNIINIYINYAEVFEESYKDNNIWSNLLFNNNLYLSSK